MIDKFCICIQKKLLLKFSQSLYHFISSLVSTGAFEITVDNMPVWSKIESGRIPQPPELFQIIDTHLKMNSGQDAMEQFKDM